MKSLASARYGTLGVVHSLYAAAMPNTASAVLDAFEQLPPQEQRMVVAQLLHRTGMNDYGALSDDDLTAAGDERFQTLDEEEANAAATDPR